MFFKSLSFCDNTASCVYEATKFYSFDTIYGEIIKFLGKEVFTGFSLVYGLVTKHQRNNQKKSN